MTLEENILAYLDGSLGADQSAELLHTLSASPDKREILEEHLRLKEITALGKRPYAVPDYAEKALAERLPAIQRSSYPVRPRMPFFSTARVMSAAAGVGALAVIGALLWNTGQPVTVPTASKPTLSAQTTPSIVLPGSSQSGSDISGAAPRSQQSSSVDHSNTAGSNPVGTNLASANPAGINVSDLNMSGIERIAHRSHVAMPPMEEHANATPETIALRDGVLDAQAADVSAPSTDPRVGESVISSVAVRETECAIPGSRVAHTISEIAYTEPSTVHAFSFGVNYSDFQYSLPRIGVSGAAASVMAGDVSATLNYNVSSGFALGFEAGLSRYAILTSAPSIQMGLAGATQNYARLSYSTTVGSASTDWLRLGVEYSPNPESDYPVTFGAASGVAFESTIEPIGALSAGLSRFIGGGAWLDLALIATGTWGSPSQAAGSSFGSTTDVTGIVHSDVTPQQTFTPAIGVRFGLRYR